ncbi:MAG: TIM barrel protein [Planctomycetota bacterium]
MNRRRFIAGTTAGIFLPVLPASGYSIEKTSETPYRYCAFIKYLQEQSHEQLAETLKTIGFDGAEVTVRQGGYISPEKAVDELPALAQVFEEYELSIDILTTDIVGPDSPHAQGIIDTAAQLGIQYYRMGFYRYDLESPIRPQLESFKPMVDEVAALNREAGVSAVYQNHSGGKYVGASFWDLVYLLENIPREEIGCIFDIRHAVAEGSGAWPVFYDIIKPHISALSAKDFCWQLKRESDERLSPVHCPLGEGQVDYDAFCDRFKQDFPEALITIHVEYLRNEGLEANIAALDRDFTALKAAMD